MVDHVEWLREPLGRDLPRDVSIELVGILSDNTASLSVVVTWRKTEYRFVRLRRQFTEQPDMARLRRAHKNMVEHFITQHRYSTLSELCCKLKGWTNNSTIVYVLQCLCGGDNCGAIPASSTL